MSEASKHLRDFARQIESASSFQEWKQWFVILVGLALANGFIFALAAFFGIGRADYGIYLTMAVLAGYAFLSSYRDVQLLDGEIKRAASQLDFLLECDDIEYFLEETEHQKAHSYFRSHIESLYKIFKVSSEIQQDTLIEILNSRLAAKNRKVELHASILITIGLIGTILGLIIMMTQLTASIGSVGPDGSADIMQLLVQKGGALSGLGTAFFTTLIGAVFGGVVLRILSSIVEEGITKYVALLAELTEVNVLPILRSHSK